MEKVALCWLKDLRIEWHRFARDLRHVCAAQVDSLSRPRRAIHIILAVKLHLIVLGRKPAKKNAKSIRDSIRGVIMFASILRDLGLIRVAEMAGEGARHQAKQGRILTASPHCEY